MFRYGLLARALEQAPDPDPLPLAGDAAIEARAQETDTPLNAVSTSS